MDGQTAVVLSLQFVALFSIAGALLLYLLCKIRPGTAQCLNNYPGGGKAILVTCADNCIGLQIAVHLADRGFRVFAGLKGDGSSEDSVSLRVIKGWQKQKESDQKGQGALIPIPLDVTREDLLHEAVDIIRAHLPAGEDGIWAVVNSSSLLYRGRLENQDISHWDTILKTNVVGVLRTARTFQTLLRNCSGRLVNIGVTNDAEGGLVAYTASRYAVSGANKAIREEFSPLGIKVITLNISGIGPESLFTAPRIQKSEGETAVDITGVQYSRVLKEDALRELDMTLTVPEPKNEYVLPPKQLWFARPMSCLKSS